MRSARLSWYGHVMKREDSHVSRKALVWCVHTDPVVSQWQCVEDSECADVRGAVCRADGCGCSTSQQLALAGDACVDLAPYHTSSCVEDHQCSRLFTRFQCSRDNQTDEAGACGCQSGSHYFLGRCWPTSDFGAACTRDENCITVPRNPYALKCDGVCACADGYYERQRGECRKIAYAVGDGCVVDEDCQFANGVCDITTLRCIDTTATRTASPSHPASDMPSHVNLTSVTATAVRMTSHSVACSISSPCPEALECFFDTCVCPASYYLSDDGEMCNAELGSRSTEEQCVGLLAEVVDGVCGCPPNFFYEENMRDCVRVTRRITDSCVSDANCFTFGRAARCGPPQLWGLRSCECDTELAVWDAARQMCRLFAGIGEQCEVDSDCLAGEVQISCVGGTCACPAGLVEADGLCLTTGLGLGDACQATVECTETPNTECINGRCSCGEGYQETDYFCAAIIGGSCNEDTDCVIDNTVCVTNTSQTRHMTYTSHMTHSRDSDATRTCQCREGFVAYDDVCWTVSTGLDSPCNVTRQCEESLGTNSQCVDARCACDPGYHHRDGGCWPVTGLFEACSRSSQCYLQQLSHLTVCRNSVCQCIFDSPYNEERHTCGDGMSGGSITLASSLTMIMIALTHLTVYL